MNIVCCKDILSLFFQSHVGVSKAQFVIVGVLSIYIFARLNCKEISCLKHKN